MQKLKINSNGTITTENGQPVSNSSAKATTTNGAAITVPDSLNITQKTENILDFLWKNIRLVAVGAVALLILLKS